VIPYGDGYVYLKGDNGKYLSEGDDHYLTFDKNQQSAATRFRLERLDGSYGIRSQKSGLYFAKESGTDKIICSETYMNGSSTFTIELIELSNTPVSGMITIKGNNQKYVSSEYGRKPMNCNRDNIGDWEQFEVVDAGAGLIALKGINGKYVSSENGREAITCRRSSIGSWEKFTLISTGGNSYAIKGSNGRYLSSENGSEEMTCSRIDIGAWEEFTITNL